MFKIGTLIQIKNTFTGSQDGNTGVIIDTGVHHDGDWKYLILFVRSGHKGWWTENRLEVLCSK